jgi:hypothetical protein
MLFHNFVGAIDRIRQDIEERAYPIAAEDHASPVFVRLHAVIQTRLREDALQPQRILQAFSYVNQDGIPAFEEWRVLFHRFMSDSPSDARFQFNRSNPSPSFHRSVLR